MNLFVCVCVFKSYLPACLRPHLVCYLVLRLYTDDYTAEYYTKEGLEWIDRAYLRDVLLRHHPELKPALDTVPQTNAFVAWRLPGQEGTTCKTHKDCHDGLKCLWINWFSYTCAPPRSDRGDL